MANRLAGESSLYLRQHAGNPVDWFPWGHEAIAKAKAEQKPIFLSVGYSACHWCHVMEHESFEDEATAAVMNQHFICVKVDREERPDLDQIYMTSLQMLTREGGGWPLSVWLTPDLTPFYAGTYYPPRDMYGRPSFRRVLLAVANAWARQREQLESLGAQVAETLQSTLTHSRTDAEITDEHLHTALQALKRNYDAVHGGFGGAPKFPHPVDLRLLLRLGLRFHDSHSITMVAHTLTMMARGGICDQIGGGFHRYSVDEHWLVPHFEKMLYDNALLALTYREAHALGGNQTFREIADTIDDYVEREMLSPSGAFYSTQDADSEGEEGKFYLWSDAEIATFLGPDADFARRVWGITPQGNFEGRTILTRQHSDEDDARLLGLSMSDFQEKLRALRETLYQHRARRVWPGRDEKILTAWNGLMIAAFAKAGSDPRAAIARQAMRSILTTLRAPDGRLLRTRGDDQPAKIAAFLEDYAYIIEALIALYECDFDPHWIATAVELADIMIRDYHDADAGGFYYTLGNQGDLIARTKDWHDGSTPSGNAVAATVLLKLAILCDRPDYRAAAEKTLRAFDGLVRENPAAAAQMLIARDFYLGPVHEICVIGPRDNAIHRHLRTAFLPRCVIACHDPADGDPPTIIAPLRGKTMISNQTTTYICRDYRCDAPILGDAALDALRKLPS